MDFKIFLSVLLLNQANFKLLHWKAKGSKFDSMHQHIATKLYDMISADVDTVAEMGLRLGVNPPSYSEVYEILKDFSDRDFKMLQGTEDFDMENFSHEVDTILSDILYCIEELHEASEISNIKNIGIKSELESMHNRYDLEYRYLNRRRMGDDAPSIDSSTTDIDDTPDTPDEDIEGKEPISEEEPDTDKDKDKDEDKKEKP